MDWELLGEPAVVDRFRLLKVVREGHFVYPNWYHGNVFVDTEAIAMVPAEMARFSAWLTSRVLRRQVDTVIAVSPDASALCHAVGLRLVDLGGADPTKLTTLVARRPHLDRLFTAAGEQRIANRRVLIVGNVLNDPREYIEVVEFCRARNATVQGVAVICNRNGVTAKMLGVDKFEALVEVRALQYADESTCPLCKDGAKPVARDYGNGGLFTSEGGFV